MTFYRKMFFTSIIILICQIQHMVNATEPCSSYVDEASCLNGGSAGPGSCKWWTSSNSADFCKCASKINLDLFFAMDTSGSIGFDDFETQKEWVRELLTTGCGENARIAFDMFATTSNLAKPLQLWDIDELEAYVTGIVWTGGWTNTMAALEDALVEFQTNSNPAHEQVLVILTDGNPCMTSSEGGCPQHACDKETEIKSTVDQIKIIGVGEGLTSIYVDCLLNGLDQIIPVAEFTAADFHPVFGSLGDILCPLDLQFQVTEIKPALNDDCYRCDRFVEIYNDGISFDPTSITLNGLVVGTAPNNSEFGNVSHSQYAVFYDATTGFAANIGSGSVTCHLCDDLVCDLTQCSDTSAVSQEICHCGNAMYIPCGSGLGCSGYDCCFNNAMSNSDWYIEISDSSGKLVDLVDFDANTWTTVPDGHSYELIDKESEDNNVGSGWQSSCSPFGTPGSDRIDICPEICTQSSCEANDPDSVCDSDGQCLLPPTSAPTTNEPTDGPTKNPTTTEPTNAPTTNEPTEGPTTNEPTTNEPTTNEPTTAEPTNGPTNGQTTTEPTNVQTTTTDEATPGTIIIETEDCDSSESLAVDGCDEQDYEPDDECSILITSSFSVCYVDSYKDQRSKLWNRIKLCVCQHLFDDTEFNGNSKRCYIDKYHYGNLVDVYNNYNDTGTNCTFQQRFDISTAIYEEDCNYLQDIYEWMINQHGHLLNALSDCNLIYSQLQNMDYPQGFVGIKTGFIEISFRDETGDEIVKVANISNANKMYSFPVLIIIYIFVVVFINNY